MSRPSYIRMRGGHHGDDIVFPTQVPADWIILLAIQMGVAQAVDYSQYHTYFDPNDPDSSPFTWEEDL